MRVVVDTGVFSAALSRRRRADLEQHVGRLSGRQLFLAAVTVAELRYGAIMAGWGDARRRRLEQAIDATTVVPVSDALITTVAELRAGCRAVAHPLADPAHSNDLWIASTALHIEAPLVTADGVFVGAPGLEVLE